MNSESAVPAAPCFPAACNSPSLRPSPRPYLCRSDHGHVEKTYHVSYSQRRSFSRSQSHSLPRHQHPHSVPLPNSANCKHGNGSQLAMKQVNFLQRRSLPQIVQSQHSGDEEEEEEEALLGILASAHAHPHRPRHGSAITPPPTAHAARGPYRQLSHPPRDRRAAYELEFEFDGADEAEGGRGRGQAQLLRQSPAAVDSSEAVLASMLQMQRDMLRHFKRSLGLGLDGDGDHDHDHGDADDEADGDGGATNPFETGHLRQAKAKPKVQVRVDRKAAEEEEKAECTQSEPPPRPRPHSARGYAEQVAECVASQSQPQPRRPQSAGGFAQQQQQQQAQAQHDRFASFASSTDGHLLHFYEEEELEISSNRMPSRRGSLYMSRSVSVRPLAIDRDEDRLDLNDSDFDDDAFAADAGNHGHEHGHGQFARQKLPRRAPSWLNKKPLPTPPVMPPIVEDMREEPELRHRLHADEVADADEEEEAMVRALSLSKTPSLTPSLPELCSPEAQMPRIKDRKRQMESLQLQHQHEKRHSNSLSLSLSLSLTNANANEKHAHEKASDTVVLRELEEASETEAEAAVCSPELQRSSTSPIRLSLDIGFNVANNGQIAIVQSQGHGQGQGHEAVAVVQEGASRARARAKRKRKRRKESKTRRKRDKSKDRDRDRDKCKRDSCLSRSTVKRKGHEHKRKKTKKRRSHKKWSGLEMGQVIGDGHAHGHGHGHGQVQQLGHHHHYYHHYDPAPRCTCSPPLHPPPHHHDHRALDFRFRPHLQHAHRPSVPSRIRPSACARTARATPHTQPSCQPTLAWPLRPAQRCAPPR